MRRISPTHFSASVTGGSAERRPAQGIGKARGTPRVRGLAVALVAAALAAPATAAAKPGDLLIADPVNYSGIPGEIIRANPITGVRSLISSNAAPAGGPDLVDPAAIAVHPDGDLIVVDPNAFDGSGGVIRVDPVSGARSTISSNATPAGGPSFAYPIGIAIGADGHLLVTDAEAFGGSGGVIRINPLTGKRKTFSNNATPAGGPGFKDPVGIAIAANGDAFVADKDAFGGLGGIIRVSAQSGARSTVSANTAPQMMPEFTEPYGIAIAANGDLLVTDLYTDAYQGGGFGTGSVIRVNPMSGERTVVSWNWISGGPDFVDPAGIAIAANGDLLVVDKNAFVQPGEPGGNGGVIRVKPLSGIRTTVSASKMPAGEPRWFDPIAIAIEPFVPNIAPTAAVGVSPATPRAGEPATIDASASTDPDGSIEKFEFDTGSGFQDNGTDATLDTTFVSAGAHAVRVRVTDDRGASDVAWRRLVVEATRPPDA